MVSAGARTQDDQPQHKAEADPCPSNLTDGAVLSLRTVTARRSGNLSADLSSVFPHPSIMTLAPFGPGMHWIEPHGSATTYAATGSVPTDIWLLSSIRVKIQWTYNGLLGLLLLFVYCKLRIRFADFYDCLNRQTKVE